MHFPAVMKQRVWSVAVQQAQWLWDTRYKDEGNLQCDIRCKLLGYWRKKCEISDTKLQNMRYGILGTKLWIYSSKMWNIRYKVVVSGKKLRDKISGTQLGRYCVCVYPFYFCVLEPLNPNILDDVSGKFQGSFKSVSKVFKGRLK